MSSLLPVMLDLHQQSVTRKLVTPKSCEADKLLVAEFKTMTQADDLYRQQQKEIFGRAIVVEDTHTTIGQFFKDNTSDGYINLEDEDIEMVRDMRPGEMITIGGGATGETIIVRPAQV